MKDLRKLWRERIVKNHLDLIMLKLLREKPRWGYELNLAVRDMFKVYLSAGTLYPLLHSLDEENYIEGLWEADKGRGRRIYKITPEGEEFLAVGEKILENIFKKLRLGEPPK